MATLRALLADKLRDLQAPRNLDWTVSTSAAGPRQIGKPYLIVSQDKVEKAPQAPLGVFLATLNVLLLTHLTDPDKVDDALEGLLEHLIDMLDDPAQLPSLRWVSAERVTYAVTDTISFPAYKLELTIYYERD